MQKNIQPHFEGLQIKSPVREASRPTIAIKSSQQTIEEDP